METIAPTDTPIPNRRGYLVLASVALFAILLLGTYYLLVVRKTSPHEARFALSIGTVPASRLYVENEENKLLEPLTVSYNNEALSVLDIVKGNDGITYYILADKSPVPVGNVYKKEGTGTITKITNTPTAKYNLVYNANRTELIYLSLTYVDEKHFVSTRDWSLESYDLAQASEKKLGTGSSPVLSSDGKVLMYENNDTLIKRNLETQATSTLLGLSLYPVYAINPHTQTIVGYNIKTHALDSYTITESGSVAYSKSTPVKDIPTMLSFIGDDLYSGTVASGGTSDKKYFITKNPEKGSAAGFMFTGIEGFAAPQRIFPYEK